MSYSLIVTHPDIAAELVDVSLGETLTAGSNKKVAWCCDKGHVWDAVVSNRTRNGSGCPYCSGLRPIVGVNDLATTHPSLASQLVDSSLATKLSAGSNRRVRWCCAFGHEWETTVVNRVQHNTGCPYCAGKRAIRGVNDLGMTHPLLASELVDVSEAYDVSAGSDRKLRWQCDKGHVYVASVSSRVRGSGCPYCSNRRVLAGFNDLATTHPELAMELVDVSLATQVTYGSGKRLEWRCPEGHTWFASVVSRSGGTGCPVCAGHVVESGVNDLWTTHPQLAAELVNSEDGFSVSAGSTRRLTWCCDKGHTWDAFVYNRALYGTGCPVCSNNAKSVFEDDVFEVVQTLVGDVSVVRHDRQLIAPFELDIVVPSEAVAIEVNGCFWHSDGSGSAPTRHRDKRVACARAGYQLVQIWEDTWCHRRDVVIRMLAAKLGARDRLIFCDVHSACCRRVFARKLILGEVDSRTASEFLEANHIQGSVVSSRRFALFDGDEPVAILCLRSPSFNSRMRRQEGEWEIQRYATSCMVVGGFSRLLKYAERVFTSEGICLRRWISFSSCDVSDGGMYKACGFVLDREIDPDYSYVGRLTDWIRRPKEGFQKKRFRTDDNLVFKEGWTESVAARANGLYRCFDSGKIRWMKEIF